MAIGRTSNKKKKKIKIVKGYEYQKAMLYAIQAITGEQTHEIITNLVDIMDKHINESDIDLSLTAEMNGLHRYGCGSERRLRKYMYYPGTKLYIGLYVLYTGHYWNIRQASGNEDHTSYNACLQYNFKLPTSSLKINQAEFDEYIADGILCDASKNVEEPNLKSSLTKEEIEINEKYRKEKAKAKSAAKRIAIQKTKKLIR